MGSSREYLGFVIRNDKPKKITTNGVRRKKKHIKTHMKKMGTDTDFMGFIELTLQNL